MVIHFITENQVVGMTEADVLCIYSDISYVSYNCTKGLVLLEEHELLTMPEW